MFLCIYHINHYATLHNLTFLRKYGIIYIGKIFNQIYNYNGGVEMRPVQLIAIWRNSESVVFATLLMGVKSRRYLYLNEIGTNNYFKLKAKYASICDDVSSVFSDIFFPVAVEMEIEMPFEVDNVGMDKRFQKLENLESDECEMVQEIVKYSFDSVKLNT